MLPNGHQPVDTNKNNVKSPGSYPGFYQHVVHGQPLMVTANGMPYLVQPAYNNQHHAIYHNQTKSYVDQQENQQQRLQQQQQLKKQKNIKAFSSDSGPKNADDMIKSIVSDPKRLAAELSKKINSNVHASAKNVGNFPNTTNNNNNIKRTACDNSNNVNIYNYCLYPAGQLYDTSSSFSNNPTFGHQRTNFASAASPPLEDDFFGDFVSTGPEPQNKPTASSPEVFLPPQPQPSSAHLRRTPLGHIAPPVCFGQFAPVAEVGQVPDSQAMYGIEMPRWITHERMVPELYTRVFNSVTRDGVIDTGLVYSELLKSTLPKEQLGHLWNLCNRRVQGILDRSELYLMLAMISICQNKLDSSSLAVLTKCPQAPIPKLNQLEVVADSRSRVFEGKGRATNTTNKTSSTSSGRDFKAAESLAVKKVDNNIICNLPLELAATQTASTTPTTVKTYNNNDVVHQSQHPQQQLQCTQNSIRNGIINSASNSLGFPEVDDGDFDDFQTAPDLCCKQPSLPISPSSSSSPPSSSVASSLPPTLASSSLPSSSTLKSPIVSVQNPKSPPTLLSLASPLMIASQLHPPLPSSSSSSSSSSAIPASSLTTSSPSLMLSDTVDMCSDKYAAFRELQKSEMNQAGSDNEEFGEFESSCFDLPHPAPAHPSHTGIIINPGDIKLQPPTNLLEENSDEFADFASAEMLAGDFCSSSSIGNEAAAAAGEKHPAPNVRNYDSMSCFTEKGLLRGSLGEDSNKGRGFKGQHLQGPHLHHDNRNGADWSDFLGLDKNSTIPVQSAVGCDDNDDDFNEFASYEVNSQNAIDEKFKSWSNNAELNDYTSGNDGLQKMGGANQFDWHTHQPLNSELFLAPNSKFSVSGKDGKQNLPDIDFFNVGVTSGEKKEFYLNKDGGMSSAFDSWGSVIGCVEDKCDGMQGCDRTKNKVLDDDGFSVRSLELRVTKPVSSAPAVTDSLTPDDSQSTSSATDLEKKSGDDRSISSLDLFPCNGLNVYTANSSNSLAGITDLTMTLSSARPLDAKEILDRVGGVIAADRYYDLVDHTQDSDSHTFQWSRCLKVVQSMLKEANKIFGNIRDKNFLKEAVKVEKGLVYMKGLVEIFLVAMRISYQMKASSIYTDELRQLQKSIDSEWQNLSSILPNDDAVRLPHSILSSLDLNDPSHHHLLLQSTDLDAYKRSCGLCLLRVLDAQKSTGLGNKGAVDPLHASSPPANVLEYASRSYHPQCANFWINCVDLTLPSLNIPELL